MRRLSIAAIAVLVGIAVLITRLAQGHGHKDVADTAPPAPITEVVAISLQPPKIGAIRAINDTQVGCN